VGGIDVGRSVAVGKRDAAGVGVAGWQAVMRVRHPKRTISFFIELCCFQPAQGSLLIEIDQQSLLVNLVCGDGGN